MADDNTTKPMLESLLEGQRQLAASLAELRASISSISEKQEVIAANQEALATKVGALDGRVGAIDGRVGALDGSVGALAREVRDGFDEYNRRIGALNNRLLSFETWLSRIDDRLHDEIASRAR